MRQANHERDIATNPTVIFSDGQTNTQPSAAFGLLGQYAYLSH